MLQPDLGTGVVLVGASLLIIYTAGARLLHLSYLGMIGVAGFVGLSYCSAVSTETDYSLS